MGNIPSSLIASSIPTAPLKFRLPSFTPCDMAVLKDQTSLFLPCPAAPSPSDFCPAAAPPAASPLPFEAVADGGDDILGPQTLLCGRLLRLFAGTASNEQNSTRPTDLKPEGIHLELLWLPLVPPPPRISRVGMGRATELMQNLIGSVAAARRCPKELRSPFGSQSRGPLAGFSVEVEADGQPASKTNSVPTVRPGESRTARAWSGAALWSSPAEERRISQALKACRQGGGSDQRWMANNYTAWVFASIGASAGAVLFFGVDRFLPGTSIPWLGEAASSGAADGGQRQVAQLAKAVSRIQAIDSRIDSESGVSKVCASASPPPCQKKVLGIGLFVAPSLPHTLMLGHTITLQGENDELLEGVEIYLHPSACSSVADAQCLADKKRPVARS